MGVPTNYNIKWIEKIWWAIPLAMLLYASFHNEGYRANIAWSAAIAAIACILTIALASYRLASFVTIFCLMTLISYPLAAFANLLSGHPAVREELWVQTDFAMWGCAIGALSMALGVGIQSAYSKWKGSINSAQFNFQLAPIGLNFGLFLILPVVAVIKLHLGLYYHSSIQPYNFANQHYLNFLEHLTWIAYSGIFLQMGRFIQTGTLKDGLYILAMAVFAIFLFLPSGNRVQAIGFLPLLLIAYLSWEPRLRRKIWISCLGVIATMCIFYAMAIYRSIPELDKYDFGEKAVKFIGMLSTPNLIEDKFKEQFVFRISDYVSTGRIIATTPELHPFRFSEGMGSWWQIMVPGFLRPTGQELNFMEGAETTLKYGVSVDRKSSTPVMFVGDLYSRFGWGGVIGGMLLLGMVLQKLDESCLKSSSFQKIFFFIFFARVVFHLYTDSVLIAFASLTRELVFIYILSYLLGKLASKLSVCFFMPFSGKFPFAKNM